MNIKLKLKRMHGDFRTILVGFLFTIITFLSGSALDAGVGPESNEGGNDKKAEQVMEKSIEAVGGKKAFSKIKNRYSEGSVELKGMGIKMEIKVYQASPNRFYSVMESSAVGKIETGSNGEIGWNLSAMQGPQLKEGEEMAMDRFTNRLDSWSSWRELFTRVSYLGEVTVNGEASHKLKLFPKEMQPIIAYFSKKTYLNNKMEMVVKTAMGQLSFVMDQIEYREIDGIRYPVSMVMSAMGQKMTYTMTTVKHNIEMPKGIFDIPEEIKKLLAKKQKLK